MLQDPKIGDIVALNPTTRGFSARKGARATIVEASNTHVRVAWDETDERRASQSGGTYSRDDFDFVSRPLRFGPVDLSDVKVGDRVKIEFETVVVRRPDLDGDIEVEVRRDLNMYIDPKCIVGHAKTGERPLKKGEAVMFKGDKDRTPWVLVDDPKATPRDGKLRVPIYNSVHGYSTAKVERLERAA